MRYKLATNKNMLDNWIVASLGNDSEDGNDYYLTTDQIPCSENVGDAKTDGELIIELLNLFCNFNLKEGEWKWQEI